MFGSNSIHRVNIERDNMELSSSHVKCLGYLGQVDELAAAHRRYNAESTALQEGRVLLGVLSGEAPAMLDAAVRCARAAAAEAAQEFIHSACRHLYFQRAEAQLLLRKLLFCAAELQSRHHTVATSLLNESLSSNIFEDFNCSACQKSWSWITLCSPTMQLCRSDWNNFYFMEEMCATF